MRYSIEPPPIDVATPRNVTRRVLSTPIDVAATDESADVEAFMPDSPTIEYDVSDSAEASIEETMLVDVAAHVHASGSTETRCAR